MKKTYRFAEAAIPFGDKEDSSYRKLTARAEVKDLPEYKHERMLKIAHWLSVGNLMAKRLLEIQRDFLVGDGVTYTAEDERTKKILDAFWDDPVNSWDIKLEDRVNELNLYGEQFWQVFVNDVTGHVRLGAIDPLCVKEVVSDPDNAEVKIKIKLKPKTDGSEGVTLDIIRPGEDGRLVGDVFFFKINSVLSADRGISELFAAADWIDLADQFILNRQERTAFLNAFLWDVEIKGADEAACDEYSKKLKLNPPKPGSWRVHNEKVKWSAVVPDLKGNDATNEYRILKLYILSGFGFPEHWFSDGGNANRNTSESMGLPTLKRLKRKQLYWKHILTYVFRFVIDQAVMHGAIFTDQSFDILFPEISEKDAEKTANTIEKTGNSVALAVSQEFLSKETATKVYANAVSRSGAQVDSAQEVEKIEAEKNKQTEIDSKGVSIDE